MSQIIQFTMVYFTVGSIEVIKVSALPVHPGIPTTVLLWWVQTWKARRRSCPSISATVVTTGKFCKQECIPVGCVPPAH